MQLGSHPPNRQSVEPGLVQCQVFRSEQRPRQTLFGVEFRLRQDVIKLVGDHPSDRAADQGLPVRPGPASRIRLDEERTEVRTAVTAVATAEDSRS